MPTEETQKMSIQENQSNPTTQQIQGTTAESLKKSSNLHNLAEKISREDIFTPRFFQIGKGIRRIR